MTRSDTALPPADLASLVDAIGDYAIFLLGPEGDIRSWNRGAERTMGYTADEIVGSPFTRFYGPEDLAARKPQMELETAAREGRIEDEGWRIRKDGTRFWANTVITALRHENGEVYAFAKITRDLTQRREAEEALRQSEEMFRLLVSSVQEYAIFMLNADGHIATWNAGAQRIKGYTANEIIGQHFSVFYSEEDLQSRKPERELEFARRDGSVEDEGWRVRKDGTRFWANVVITAVFDRENRLRGFAKVTRDMTERRRVEDIQQALFEQREARLIAEEERRRAEASSRMAQEANRAKDQFLMTLSHELRTPMTSILGWSRLLAAMSPHDPAFRDAITAIGRSAELQARLIDDVLDVSRIVSGKLQLNITDIDLEQLLASSLETVRLSAEAKLITLETQLQPELGSIVGDETRLQQVIWNLLTNAVKFTSRQGLVKLIAERTASHVCISVVDTGEGIPLHFLPYVFEPFRQAENASTRVHGGLGLGLSIVRYLVEAHGGTIEATSEGPGKGATFTVKLPIRSVPLAQPREERPTAPPRRLAGAKILTVDDDEEARKIVRLVLQHGGAEVIACSSATEALNNFERYHPDIVITDIAMPHVDGYELANRVRALDPRVPIVAVSAFPSSRGNVAQGVFDAYMSKPLEPNDLIATIARVLGR
ncbi:MAG TPA: PAS domain S-box protein [Thermoanaerobaculia bacterium]|nr:PAS domain S-box protein [Thermoanaerobaculia bacterium]